MTWKYWRTSDPACEECLHTCKFVNCRCPFIYYDPENLGYCKRHYLQEVRWQDNLTERIINNKKAKILKKLINTNGNRRAMIYKRYKQYKNQHIHSVAEYWANESMKTKDPLIDGMPIVARYNMIYDFQQLVDLFWRNNTDRAFGRLKMIDIYSYFIVTTSC